MNSTPSRSSSIMRFTALPPPPPTPTTFMRAFCGIGSSYSKIILGSLLRTRGRVPAVVVDAPVPGRGGSEEVREPVLHALQGAGNIWSGGGALGCVVDQSAGA